MCAYENAKDDQKLKLKQKYLLHQQQIVLSRQEKQRDKDNCSDKNIVWLLEPKGDVSVFNYKNKLNCQNFPITDIRNKKSEWYFWHEGAGNWGTDELASSLLKYIEKAAVCTAHEDDNYNITI